MVKSFKLNTRMAGNGSPLRLVLFVVLLLIACLAVLELTNTTHFFHKRKATSGVIPSQVVTATPEGQEGEPVESNAPPTSQTPSDKATGQANSTASTSDKPGTAPNTSGADLAAPSGNFVSNHKPSLRNSSGMESVCVTTPGASCTIVFTKDGITKTLETKKANSEGTVIWYWDLKTAGFVEGTWNITATAASDGKTKSTSDIQKLEVQP